MTRSKPGAVCRFATVASLLLACPVASGAGPEGVVAPAGGGQGALAVGFDAAGALRARVCASVPCTLETATPIPAPGDTAKLAGGAVLRVVRVGRDRTAVIVEIPDVAAARTWTALIAAPLAGTEPLVPFAEYTGLTSGVEGERSGWALRVRDEGVYVGTTREDRDLCGRPVLLAPRVLDPATLTLRSAKLQQLTEAERKAAPRLVATRVDGAPPPPLLRAAWATSAAAERPPSAVTDAHVETAWAENRSGVGRGEALVLRVPREVPLATFEIAPPTAAAAPKTNDGAAPLIPPRELWVATDHELFFVTLPDGAARTGGRFAVTLPQPVQTSCLALVVESAGPATPPSAGQRSPEVDVGIAEVWGRPALPGTLEELVKRLDAGGGDGAAAAAILRSSGPESFTLVAAAFGAATEEGRRAALDVLDDAPCNVALPVYVEALTSDVPAHRDHARSALPRCGAEGPAAMALAMKDSKLPHRLALADELVAVAPGAAVDVLVPRLEAAREKERRAYRAAIARAAESTEGAAALARALARTDLPPGVTLDLLRATGSQALPLDEPVRHAFARLAVDDAPLRVRYLLVGPAAFLAEREGAARTFLRHALTLDESPYVRAEAARQLRSPARFFAELSRAADDPDVRVREAAVHSLGLGKFDAAGPRLVYRLRYDPWPFVRSAAARSLVALGANPDVDTALAFAITHDEAPEVRRAAVLGVAGRHVASAVALVRERFLDRLEADSVRAAAAVSLGMLCDAASTDALTESAGKLGNPTADDRERRVGEGALAGLGLLRPADLAQRLAPFTAPKAPPALRRLAAATLAASTRSRCTPPAARSAGK